jgi:hypothetical protein
MERVLSSSVFQGAGRSRALLKFLVEESVADRTERLKEYTIGAEALAKGDAFDPRTDPIVRAEASRLRSRLERYYASEGRDDPVVIVLPSAMRRTCPVQAGEMTATSSLRSVPARCRACPRQVVSRRSSPTSQASRSNRDGRRSCPEVVTCSSLLSVRRAQTPRPSVWRH